MRKIYRLLSMLFMITMLTSTIPMISAGTANSPALFTLYAGQDIPVGHLRVWNDDDNLYVKYLTDGGWMLVETHLSVEILLDDIPQTKSGNPIPGKFEYKMEHMGVTEYLYTIPLDDIGNELRNIHIAAHAVVEHPVDGCETAWAVYTCGEWHEFEGKNWATYCIYRVQYLDLVNVTLVSSVDEMSWGPVGGSYATGFNLPLQPLEDYIYLDVEMLTTTGPGIDTGTYFPFYLDTTNLPAEYYEWWEVKGVMAGASGWQHVMYEIITGNQPMFYLVYTGSDYQLKDGLLYLIGSGYQTLRISGLYYPGEYTFTGSLSLDGLTTDVEIDLEMTDVLDIWWNPSSTPMVTKKALWYTGSDGRVYEYRYSPSSEIKIFVFEPYTTTMPTDDPFPGLTIVTNWWAWNNGGYIEVSGDQADVADVLTVSKYWAIHYNGYP